jgi:hypothetical protein
MDFARSTLTALLDDDSQRCTSFFMPVTVAGRERTGNRIRFKNLIRDAQELLEHSSDDVDATELLRPLRELYENEQAEVWQHPTPGLALFRSPKRCEAYTVRNEQNEEVHVGNRFNLRPMLRLLPGTADFTYLLPVGLSCDSLRAAVKPSWSAIRTVCRPQEAGVPRYRAHSRPKSASSSRFRFE